MIVIDNNILRHMELPENFRTEGWIYILENECMPDIYKVGMTTINPETRAKELSGATGVPIPFKLICSFYSSSPKNDELKIHDYLSEYRVNESREFFRCDIKVIKDTCLEVCIGTTGATVQELANTYDIISLGSAGELNIADLLDDLGIVTVGPVNHIAEALIKIGLEYINKVSRENRASAVFSDNKVNFVISDMHSNYEEHLLQQNEKADGDF